ncbi:Cys-tRNA(Pro) deacylase [Pullulanibacillus sp. KACC 23026]|uniref:Cys-tRNA(Pro) deacylase n=1 Tax=Pullulanibacillus sp. KACC 23026 TaxID=3028315 RepID=UPI0023B0B1EE|nr:Cys-tRNA(Pro) deacylase [Pullulanibacillus sp. KACC 23026]WEG11485.1 Cys-tRNA(Pro) deacylase [Pullulanibacillus sp. KACC 23026]
MSAKTNACRVLDKNHIAYSLHEYEWKEEELDAVTVAAKLGLFPSHIFKTLVLRGDKTGILMACIPGDKELDLKALANFSGNKKVEMVAVKEIQGLTGYIRGGVSPLGVKKAYPLYLDQSIEPLDPISISAGKRGQQIFLKGVDLIKVTQGTTGSFTK